MKIYLQFLDCALSDMFRLVFYLYLKLASNTWKSKYLVICFRKCFINEVFWKEWLNSFLCKKMSFSWIILKLCELKVNLSLVLTDYSLVIILNLENSKKFRKHLIKRFIVSLFIIGIIIFIINVIYCLI